MIKEKPSILIIYTGGTIGMVQDTETAELKPFDFEHISKEVPELKRLDVVISSISFVNPIDSSNMNPNVWGELATIIEENYNAFDGFVILHGSDTMAYTASALSFLLENLAKPVILTGSQLPIGIIRTDGKENLITAVEIAADQINGVPVVQEVAVYFEDYLYRGNRTRKYNAEHFDAFESPNYAKLAEVGININYNHSAINKAKGDPLIVHKKMCSNVAILKLFPGITPAVVNSILEIEGLKGVILESFGSGNAPTEKWFIDALKRATEKGLLMLNITQCNQGSVNHGLYETSGAMNKIGVISGRDMTTEAALAKMMFLLENCASEEKILEKFSHSICGEVTFLSSYYGTGEILSSTQ